MKAAVRDVFRAWGVDEEASEALAARLLEAYSEPHRRYHTLAHIEHCLLELARVERHAAHPDEVKWALVFHDAIYDPRRDDNEARSADWACKTMMDLARPPDATHRVRRMILATAHDRSPETPDEALVLDIDLSILCAEERVFDDYNRAVREEYAHVPEESYRKGRAKILESFARRKRLFHTAAFRSRCEDRARANIRRALKVI